MVAIAAITTHGGQGGGTRVIVVQAPSLISSTPTGTGAFGVSTPLPTVVPLVESRSTICQPPSGWASSMACSADTPGSSGGPLRSMSGSMPRERLRRPMVSRSPSRANRRSGQNGGNDTSAVSGPSRRRTSSNQSRSARTTADQPVRAGRAFEAGPTHPTLAAAASAAAIGSALSCPHASQNLPSRAAPQLAHTSGASAPALPEPALPEPALPAPALPAPGPVAEPSRTPTED